MKLELEKDLPLPALETAAPGPTYRAVSDPFNQRSSMDRTGWPPGAWADPKSFETFHIFQFIPPWRPFFPESPSTSPSLSLPILSLGFES